MLASIAQRIMPQLNEEEREASLKEIALVSRCSRSYVAMVIISTSIAAFGLLSNSAAVVIGAMLIAPLMGPILGVSAGLTMGNSILLRRAVLAEVVGVVTALAVGYAVGCLPMRPDFGSEVLNRTHPTPYDIGIALASGLAASYAMVNSRLSATLAGVAIATSLVPPLATSGLCAADGRWQESGAAFLLFLANFFAIELAAAAVFIAFGLHENVPVQPTKWRNVKHFGFSASVLLIIAVLVSHSLFRTLTENRQYRLVEQVLSQQLRSGLAAQLSNLQVRTDKANIEVMAVVFTPEEVSPAMVKSMEAATNRALHRPAKLMVRSLISRDVNRDGTVYIATANREQREQMERQRRLLNGSSTAIKGVLQHIPGARLVDTVCTNPEGVINVTAVVQTPVGIEPNQVALMESALSKRLDAPAKLVVRSLITRDADSHNYLYDKNAESEGVTSADPLLHERLKNALANQLWQQVEGATLAALRLKFESERLLVLAVARTPEPIGPERVRSIEQNLQRYVEPKCKLILRSKLETDASSEGYLSEQSRLTGMDVSHE